MLWLLAGPIMVLPLLPLRGRLAFRWRQWAILVAVAGPILGLSSAAVEAVAAALRPPMRALLSLALAEWLLLMGALLYALHKQRAGGVQSRGSAHIGQQNYQSAGSNPGPLVYVQTVYQRSSNGTKAFVVIDGETTIRDAWFNATDVTEGWWYYARTIQRGYGNHHARPTLWISGAQPHPGH